MSLQFWFWLVMAAWLFFGLWRARVGEGPYYERAGVHVLGFLAILIVGWKVFGSPVN